MVPDHAGGEVDVEVAGQRPESVGRRDVSLLEDGFPGAVTVDDGKPLIAGAPARRLVAFDHRHLVALVTQDACCAQTDPSSPDNHEPHAQGYAGPGE